MAIWIGEIQWRRRNGSRRSVKPILKPLDTIECRDAIRTSDALEPDWPEADVVIGNPPFLGNRKMRGELGSDYVDSLKRIYRGAVDGRPDLVCYWFAKAGRLLANGDICRVGLVATNSIRGGTNRAVLKRILKDSTIFNAWADERGSSKERPCECHWFASRVPTTSPWLALDSMASMSTRSIRI